VENIIKLEIIMKEAESVNEILSHEER